MSWAHPLALTVHTERQGMITDHLPGLIACRNARLIAEAAILKGASAPLAVEVQDAAFRLVFIWVNPLGISLDTSPLSTKG